MFIQHCPDQQFNAIGQKQRALDIALFAHDLVSDQILPLYVRLLAKHTPKKDNSTYYVINATRGELERL